MLLFPHLQLFFRFLAPLASQLFESGLSIAAQPLGNHDLPEVTDQFWKSRLQNSVEQGLVLISTCLADERLDLLVSKNRLDALMSLHF